MNDEMKTMARDFFGYGRWDTPYWFIGPEPAGDNHAQRAAAFKKLEHDGLCDCKEFHDEIKVDWSNKPQKTWNRLMLLLKSFLGEEWKKEFCDNGDESQSLLSYQRSRWGSGSREGNTCVIELRGLNTKGNDAYRTICAAELPVRIARINEKLKTSQEKPKLVVMYGKSEERSWRQIAEFKPLLDNPLRRDSTTFVFAYHPNARGVTGNYWLKESYWTDLGIKAREASNES
jgi:hypothetical protein